VPKQVNHEERRREIATATWQAINELGVEGTTMRAIADRAGCTIGRLNHYFDSREDMLVAALRQANQDAADRMARATEGRSGRDALRAVLLEALPLDEQRRTEWKVWLTFWAQAIATDSLREEHAARYREWRQLVATLVAGAAPSMRRADVARTADALLAVVDGIGIQTSMATSEDAVRRARRTIDTTLDGLLGGRPRGC
jgi:AcrR family transcriptional regulator